LGTDKKILKMVKKVAHPYSTSMHTLTSGCIVSNGNMLFFCLFTIFTNLESKLYRHHEF